MKRKAKKKQQLDLRDPKRRVSTAWVRNFVKNYHDTYIMPLVARVELLEQIIADNAVPNTETQKIDIGDRAARLALNETHGLALELPIARTPAPTEEPDTALFAEEDDERDAA